MLNELNHALFLFLNADKASPDWLVLCAKVMAEAPQFILAIMLVCFWMHDVKGGWPAAIKVGATMTLALTLSMIIGILYPVERPFVIGLGTQWVWHSPDPSFPSDHATLLFAIACSCLGRPGWPVVGWTALALGVVNGWARIVVGLHYPLDIAAALVVGLFSAVIVRKALDQISARRDRLVERNTQF